MSNSVICLFREDFPEFLQLTRVELSSIKLSIKLQIPFRPSTPDLTFESIDQRNSSPRLWVCDISLTFPFQSYFLIIYLVIKKRELFIFFISSVADPYLKKISPPPLNFFKYKHPVTIFICSKFQQIPLQCFLHIIAD